MSRHLYTSSSLHNHNQTTIGRDQIQPVMPRSSTPIQAKTPRSQLESLQRQLSAVELENQTLSYENDQLRQENEQLKQALQEKEVIQAQMRQKMETVTHYAVALCERIRCSKARYYEKHGIDACAGDYHVQQEK